MSRKDIGITLAVAIVLCIIPTPATLGFGLIAALATWIFAMVAAAQKEAWGWFMTILLLPALGTLIYALAGPDD